MQNFTYYNFKRCLIKIMSSFLILEITKFIYFHIWSLLRSCDYVFLRPRLLLTIPILLVLIMLFSQLLMFFLLFFKLSLLSLLLLLFKSNLLKHSILYVSVMMFTGFVWFDMLMWHILCKAIKYLVVVFYIIF